MRKFVLPGMSLNPLDKFNVFKIYIMSSSRKGSGTPQTMRVVFGIFMILVYLGVGFLFMIGFFDPLFGGWPWMKWVCGGILIAYGIWRGYRQFAGIDKAYSSRDDDE